MVISYKCKNLKCSRYGKPIPDTQQLIQQAMDYLLQQLEAGKSETLVT